MATLQPYVPFKVARDRRYTQSLFPITNRLTVTPYVETLLVEYQVPQYKTYYLEGFMGSGNGNGIFRLKQDGVSVFPPQRTSEANRDFHVLKDGGLLTFTSGKKVQLWVYHENDANLTFEGCLLGFLDI